MSSFESSLLSKIPDIRSPLILLILDEIKEEPKFQKRYVIIEKVMAYAASEPFTG
ncbi:hypothetical protein F210042A8_18800 [Blautia parvula]